MDFQNFIVKHGLIDQKTGERLLRFCWCSDGPFDVRDFVVKQCFISKVSIVWDELVTYPLSQPVLQISMPAWFQGDILDVRTVILKWLRSTKIERVVQESGVPVSCQHLGGSRFPHYIILGLGSSHTSFAKHSNPTQGPKLVRLRRQASQRY
jgi:3'-5' exoribonuclease 1